MVDAVRGYRFFGATVSVACDAPAVAAWLDEFLQPAFEPWAGEAETAVSVRTDPSAHAALAATRPAHALEDAACFALDTHVVAHPAWRVGGRTVLADARYAALYALDGRTVEVLAAPVAPLFRGGVMRVVREAATAHALASPARLQLHAAALEADERAVLIAGPKGAGKTTLLAYLAASTGARILANDRVVVERAAGGHRVRGVPTLVSVRPETRALVPRLHRGITLERLGHLTIAEAGAAMRETEGPGAATPIRMSPPQLAGQLGVELGSEAPLAAVVFPGRADRPDEVAVERLARRDAERHLLASRFGTSSGRTVPTVFERLLRAPRPANADAALVDALAAGVPCFAVRVGRARFADPGAAATLLGAVLAGQVAA
jgi:hypothetical protein